MKAQDAMRAPTSWARAETTTCQQAAQLMIDHNVRFLYVLDDEDRLVGIVTDHDLCCRTLHEDLSPASPADVIASEPVASCQMDCELGDVRGTMAREGVDCVAVVDPSGKLRGMIRDEDLSDYASVNQPACKLGNILPSV